MNKALNLYGYIRVSEDGRSFCDKNQKPFFWLADTVWAAGGYVTMEEWKSYINYRSIQGFNAVQIYALPQYETREKPKDEFLPFAKEDGYYNYDRIQKDYFLRLGELVKYANEKGIIVGICILWYDVVPNARQDLLYKAQPMSHRMSLGQTEEYVHMLIQSMKNYSVIWIASGDDDFSGEGVRDFYVEVIKKIREWDSYHRLITAHSGTEPGDYFTESDCLDFNMVQSSHGDLSQDRTYKYCYSEWMKPRIKPVLNGELCYEGFFGWDQGHQFNSRDLRYAFWESVLSGSLAGITYGADGMWNFMKKGESQTIYHSPNQPQWQEALLLDGACDFVRAKEYLTQFPYQKLLPKPEKILSQTVRHQCFAVTKEKNFAMAYLPDGGEFNVCAGELDERCTVYMVHPQTFMRTDLGDLSEMIHKEDRSISINSGFHTELILQFEI